MKAIHILIWTLFFLENHSIHAQDIFAEAFATGINQPVAISFNSTGQMFVAENGGLIKRIDNTGNATLFLNITSKTNGAYSGIHGLAFDPNFQTNGYFYIKYVNAANQNCYISRFNIDPVNTSVALLSSEHVLIQYPNWIGHLGGNIEFGKDGYLYFTTGDGAPGGRGQIGDEYGYAQNWSSVKGKLMRISVSNGTLDYPSENPFTATNDNIPNEIIANGLRNAWKFSFDKLTGDLWLGDIGQDLYEELNYVPFGSFENKNFGWSCFEGFYPVYPNNCLGLNNLVTPIYTYQGYNFNGHIAVSITGGYVYRGSKFADLSGWYIFADYATSNFWKLRRNNDSSVEVVSLGQLITNPVTFGQSIDGELFVASYSNGIVYKIKKSCESNKALSGQHSQSGTFSSSNSIVSNALVLPSLNVQYSAGKKIELTQGFVTQNGAVFTAETGGCN